MRTPDTINGKTPEEIKKGLRWCGGIAQIIKGCAGGCPYYVDGDGCAIENMHADALAYIQQLQYALLLMISQYCTEPDETTVTHRFMSAGEHAFEVLGIKESHISTDELETMIERLEKEMYP